MRTILLFLASIGLLTSCSTTTVYIVRHAEKVNETDSTDLSAVGFRRAEALANVLGKRNVDSIFTTPYRRTRQTAEPLAKRMGIPIMDYPAKPTEAIVNRIKPMRNKTVLVVGHSNTILDIARGFGVQPTIPKIESGDFDNLLRIRIYRGPHPGWPYLGWPFSKSVTLLETTYGQITLPDFAN